MFGIMVIVTCSDLPTSNICGWFTNVGSDVKVTKGLLQLPELPSSSF
jgi:hypothetical protein